jgi:hypothetical protein
MPPGLDDWYACTPGTAVAGGPWSGWVVSARTPTVPVAAGQRKRMKNKRKPGFTRWGRRPRAD